MKIKKVKLGSPNYINQNCWLVKSLGRPAYKRCQYCELKYPNCVFLHYQLVTLGLIIFCLVLDYIVEQKISELAIFYIFIPAIVYGYFFNKTTDKIIETNFAKKAAEERALKEKISREAVEKLDAAKTMFLSIASHQMRTPLTIIKGYLSLALSGDYGKVEGQVKDFLEQVYRANEREIALVNDLLDLTRIQAGKILYSFEDLSIEDLTAEVVKEIQPEAQTKNLQLVFDKPKEPLPKVKADSQKLRQVIFNLLDNAIKYTKQGEVRVSLEFNPHNQTILLKVKDTGMGMSPEEINNLFQLFNRSQAAVNTYPSGVGIGLYFASEIVKAHQGRIWAESAGINQGSTFYVELKTKEYFR